MSFLLLCLGAVGLSLIDIEKLISEQKYQEASKELQPLISEVRTKNKEFEYARLLTKDLLLKLALHGYESALSEFRSQKWPKDPIAYSMMSIVYAKVLTIYNEAYSWEIRSREKIGDKSKFDLKSMTTEEIYKEALSSYEKAWDKRGEFGKKARDAFGEYISPNTYPKEIRGTLRDTISHLLTDLLNNTSGWSPTELNEVYLQEINYLLNFKQTISLKDPSIHPLKKMAYVLNDLNAWHRQRGNKNASLDARLKLYQILHQHLKSESSRTALINSLNKELAANRDNDWVSMGFSLLAQFYREESGPRNNLLALEAASKGQNLYPRSPGAGACADIINDIKEPYFSIEGMNIDGYPKRTLKINYRNLRKLYFRSYQYDLKKFIETTQDYSLRPGPRELKKILAQKAYQTWSQDLIETKDFKNHSSFVVPPKHQNGFYVIIASEYPDFRQGRIQGLQIFFSEISFNVSRHSEREEFVVEVFRGENGSPVKGARVSFYEANYQKGHNLLSTKTTNESGVASLSMRSLLQAHRNYFFLVEKGEDLIGPRGAFYMYSQTKDSFVPLMNFVYTDRSIYRPEQKVFWKIVAYNGNRGGKSYKVAPKTQVIVQLKDANSEIVSSSSVTTNEYGSASGEFELPKGRLLGNWSISTASGDQAIIKVEEYKRPTFVVEMSQKGENYRLNHEATLRGTAKYYFGTPLSKGLAKWTIHRRANLPWWCFWGNWDWNTSLKNQLVSTGMSEVKDDGSFEIKFTPKGDEAFSKSPDISYSYSIKVNVTDEGGETQSTEHLTTVGFIAARASLTLDKNFYLINETPSVEVNRSDLSGKELPGPGSWKLFGLKQPDETLVPGDLSPPKEFTELGMDEFKHPDDFLSERWRDTYNYQVYLRNLTEAQLVSRGEAHTKKFILPKLSEGIYRLVYESKDFFGNIFKTQTEFLVVGEKSQFKLPGIFLIQDNSVEPGEKTRILAMSGYPGQRMLLEIFKSGKLLRQEVLISGKDSPLIELPVKEDDRGGLGLTLRFVRDYQALAFSQSQMVPWSNKEVEISFSTIREKILPGSKETWSLQLKGKNNTKIDPKAFEILAYMYDKSLDAFTPHVPPAPLTIYPNLMGSSFPEYQLGEGSQVHSFYGPREKSKFFTDFKKDEVLVYPSYGVGGPGSRASFSLMKEKSMSFEEGTGAVAEMDAQAPPESLRTQTLSMPSRRDSFDKTDGPEISAQVRTNFSESGFWKPHLLTDKNGVVKLDFIVPDSVTSWSVWAHAISKDIQSGSVSGVARTVKDLMVRPYLPRFFREGDEINIRVVVNNSSDSPMSGQISFEILDEAKTKSLGSEFSLSASSAPFMAKANSSTHVSFRLKVPPQIRQIVIKASAQSGNITDSELRSLPVLPGRMHLAESKFVTLKNKTQKELTFKSLEKTSDPTLVSDAFIVTLDAQLFYSILSSVPYLYNYPYQCTELFLNNFVTSGILSSVFSQYPDVARMATQFSQRKTQLEAWGGVDPNRSLALEEAPWLGASRGESFSNGEEIISVLHPDIARNTRKRNLRELTNAQTASGGFPWISGGPPSPYITLYVLYGLSKALEFKVEVPKELTMKAWKYLHQHYMTEVVDNLINNNTGWEFITFLNFVLNNYPDSSWGGNIFTDSQQKMMLDFSFKHWKDHSPYLKAYLTRILKRANRDSDAKLVWDSAMDSARVSEDEGTHWGAEDRSWLWYNDTIETHALALRTGSEVGTKKELLDGLVHWLFLNKKLNHWKSTRSTAEVLYSLTHYLVKNKSLGTKEKMSVSLAGINYAFQFDPDKYSGKKNQLVFDQEKVNSSLVPVTIRHETEGMAFASATWHYSTEKLPEAPVGDLLQVERKYFKREIHGGEIKLTPLTSQTILETGDEVEVHLSLKTRHQMEYVHLRDPRGSGFEPVGTTSQHKWNLGLYWYEEIRDSGTNFFFEKLPQGEHTFKYRLRAYASGTFRIGPATVQPLYAPEFNGFSQGHLLKIK